MENYRTHSHRVVEYSILSNFTCVHSILPCTIGRVSCIGGAIDHRSEQRGWCCRFSDNYFCISSWSDPFQLALGQLLPHLWLRCLTRSHMPCSGCSDGSFALVHLDSSTAAYPRGSRRGYTYPSCQGIHAFGLCEQVACASWRRGGCWREWLDLGYLWAGSFMHHSYHIVPFVEGSLWRHCGSKSSTVSIGSCTWLKETRSGKYTVRYQFHHSVFTSLIL